MPSIKVQSDLIKLTQETEHNPLNISYRVRVEVIQVMHLLHRFHIPELSDLTHEDQVHVVTSALTGQLTRFFRDAVEKVVRQAVSNDPSSPLGKLACQNHFDRCSPPHPSRLPPTTTI